MKRFLLILVSCLAFLTGPAQAQDAPALSTLEIALWPEFDRPEVLVIYRGLFAPDTPLPAPVEIRIPARVGQPSAVAYVDEDGQRFNQEHTTRVDGDWLVVSFELAAQRFQFEYYDALPVDPSGRREYAYTYVADYPLTALSVEFQAPPTAEGFVLEPPADSVVTEVDGLVYHLVDVGSVAQGEERRWAFSYQKDDEELTVSAFVQPETPVPAALPAAAAADADNSAIWIFLVAFVALIAVGGGAFWLGRRTQLAPEPLPRRHKRRGSGRDAKPQRQPLSPLARDESLYCYKCGAELRPDSDFCHKCGATVRKT